MQAQTIYAQRMQELTRKKNENDLLRRQAEKLEGEILEVAKEMEIASDGLTFLEKLANSRRGKIKGRVESILTQAAQLVYGDKRRIELSYDVKNNRSHLAIEVVKEIKDGEIRRVLDGSGSGLGLSDTISVPLRLLVLLGSKASDRVCILDECYKHMSLERVPLVTEFLKSLGEQLGMQIILVSHHEAVHETVERAYKVENNGEFSYISAL